MNIFRVNEQEDTPEVLIDRDSGTVSFTGKLLPEDSLAFFSPIEEQLKNYISQPNQITTVNLRLEYMNSSSQKRVLGLLATLQNLTNSGLEVYINWYYPEDDEDLLDEGRDLSQMLEKPLNIIPY
ncbi:MAG: DUF1987 domain-containing protein [Bacteroidales bacterium]|nr:DUF1987 domain-containing protein [Bacteroidales bacterium]MDD3892177.1 DUF1987 domain-containing protein [Bacteroidales bacterium]